MDKSTVFKVFGYALIILCAIVLLELMISSGDAKEVYETYDSVKVDTTSGVSKKLMFLQEYTKMTGDTTLALSRGVDQDTANKWAQPDEGNGSGGNGSEVVGTITDTDITAIAKAICTEYVGNAGSEVNVYVASNGGPLQSTPYGNVTYNSRVLAPYLTSNGYYNRCCNGLSSGILFHCGVTTYNNGSNISGSWPYISCEDIYQRVGTQINATTFGDLQVGDIICVKNSSGTTGHVETVVKIENNRVYIASAGSSNGIRDCAAQGYNRIKDPSDSLDAFYNQSSSRSWHGLRGVVRP